jgi:hypothetical protein
MPAGRHGHKMREFNRRVDALLEAERERRKPPPPPPPPISEEHAALRKEIAEALRALHDPEDPEYENLHERVVDNPELATAAARMLGLVRKEEKLLAEHGVDYRPYESYDLS